MDASSRKVITLPNYAGSNHLPGPAVSAGIGPAPTPAQESGKKLDSGMTKASVNVNDASSSFYADNDGND